MVGLNPLHLNFMAALLSGRCYEETGEYEMAWFAYQQAGAADPRNPEPCLALARLSLARSRTEEAYNFANQALELSPKNRRAADLIREMSGRG